MNKLFKAHTLAICLLVTSAHVTCSTVPNNPPSYWQVLITFFSGNQPEQQNSSDQAPDGVTVQDYIAQFRADLNGTAQYNRMPVIPWHEVDEMAATIEQELYHTDLRNQDKTNQRIRAVICNHVKGKTILYLNQLERDGFYITPEECQSIAKSHENNIRVRLESIPHLNGESIAQYFGESHKNKIRDNLRNRGNRYNPFDPSRGAHQ